jgi:hypothetical protein
LPGATEPITGTGLPGGPARRRIAVPRQRHGGRTENAQPDCQLGSDLLQRGAAAPTRRQPFRQSVDLPIVHAASSFRSLRDVLLPVSVSFVRRA